MLLGMGLDLVHTNRVRPAVVFEILRQLGGTLFGTGTGLGFVWTG
jgi:hypothetical protein